MQAACRHTLLNEPFTDNFRPSCSNALVVSLRAPVVGMPDNNDVLPRGTQPFGLPGESRSRAKP
jgi:hypothetical protein